MAARARSRDGRKETKEIPGDETHVSQQGRSDGTLARKIATRDEEKRAYEHPAGATQVRKSDETDSEPKETR
ncbi:hypothetical protein [Rhodophyticola porphyridii]|uniref:hypothetical protein n=1 Tax=Rhodophyticola porphyridii TaxID=1852017 RepID=UPI0035CF430D